MPARPLTRGETRPHLLIRAYLVVGPILTKTDRKPAHLRLKLESANP